jgi:hypothetical protein
MKMKPPSAETIAKLESVLAFLEQEPRRLNLGMWGIFTDNPTYMDALVESGTRLSPHLRNAHYGEFLAFQEQRPPCGTVCCFAGAALIVGKIVNPHGSLFILPYNSPELAQKWLDLEGDTDDNLLFHVHNWPREFRNKIEKEKPGTQGYFEVLRDRVRYFERTGE